jgi:superfamily II DNA or RNA helicase
MKKDPRRQFSKGDHRRVHENQKRRCGVPPYDTPSGGLTGCGRRVALDDRFHLHHANPHTLGGPTVIGNAIGLCDHCHRRIDHTRLSAPTPPTPRGWQENDLPTVLDRLAANGGRYTCAAAPGAGKSLFAAMATRTLLDRGHVTRVVVVTPTDHLTHQWADEAANVGLYLDPEVKTEPDRQRRGYDGVAVTWAAFAQGRAARAHLELALEEPTLFVFDEVHHAGDHATWGMACSALVKSVPSARYLNLSGTLFRSNPGQRIAPVEYLPDPDDEGHLIAVADTEIYVEELVKQEVLRGLDLFGFGSEVSYIDPTTGEVLHGDLGVAGERKEIEVALHSDDAWVSKFLDEWLRHLDNQSLALDGHPVKGLVVARDQAFALKYRDMLEELRPGLRVWLARSDDGPAAKQALEDARKSRHTGVLVSVNMASEGYDNPDLTTIAYLSNVTAGLRLAQIAGRVMRPTRTEKDAGRNLTGTVWLPDIPAMRKAWLEVLIGELHTVSLEDLTCNRCGHQKPCACPITPGPPRVCAVCGQPKPCACVLLPQPDPDVTFSDPELALIANNGDEVNVGTYEALAEALAARGSSGAIPHLAAVLAAQADLDDADPMRKFR